MDTLEQERAAAREAAQRAADAAQEARECISALEGQLAARGEELASSRRDNDGCVCALDG